MTSPGNPRRASWQPGLALALTFLMLTCPGQIASQPIGPALRIPAPATGPRLAHESGVNPA